MREHALAVLVVSSAIWLSGSGGGGGGIPAGFGIVEGVVRDSVAQAAIVNGTVSVVGSALRSNTDAEGRYSLTEVLAGTATVRAEASGYFPRSQTADVAANSTVTVDFLLTPESGAGNAYYVSTTGGDSNPGTQDQPWRTPGYGSKQLQAGDTLMIMGGTYPMSEYWTDMITPEVSGTTDAWITIKGEEGNRPILTGRGSLLAAVEIGGRSYVSLQNLEITSEIDNPYSGGLRGGIEAGGSAGPGGDISNVVIRDVEVHRVEEAGINFAGNMNAVKLDDVYIHHTGGTGISAPGAEGGRGWENVLLRNCHVAYAGYFWHGQDQPSEWDRPDGIGMEDSEGPLEIHHCLFEHNRGDGLDSKSRNTYVHETVVANNSADSLKFWGDGSRAENVLIYGDGDGNPQNGPWASIVVDATRGGRFEFINVTVDDNVERQNYPIYMQYGLTAPATVVMRNCIIAHGSNHIYMGDSVTFTAENCMFYRAGNADESVIYVNGRDYLPAEIASIGSGNIHAEPIFVRRAWGTEGDYHLQAGSPGIDAGAATGAPATDLDGVARPQGAGFDIGAYER